MRALVVTSDRAGHHGRSDTSQGISANGRHIPGELSHLPQQQLNRNLSVWKIQLWSGNAM
jgi:hypothetical protein